jgi:hypothetical protein
MGNFSGNDWHELINARELASSFYIAATQSFPNLIKFLRILQREVRRPSIVGFSQFNIDFRRALSLVDQFSMGTPFHYRLLKKSSLQFAGSGRYAVTTIARVSASLGIPQTT